MHICVGGGRPERFGGRKAREGREGDCVRDELVVRHRQRGGVEEFGLEELLNGEGDDRCDVAEDNYRPDSGMIERQHGGGKHEAEEQWHRGPPSDHIA